MSLKAYQTTQQASETASQTEYRLFADVTRALMEAKGLSKLDQKLHDALYWNRRVWSTLATDCALEGNQLPAQLRAQIISLSIFIGKYSSQVARGEQDIQTLIDINKNIMEGLAMQAQRQSQASEAASEDKTAKTPPSQGLSYTV
ncbi:flagellar biosynthesis regulator FlaF [Luteithermobacter gelatinilyticus]|uniref:flagellar biosynthesis regulator FlaF n=1 Tax=Luteithermobacter gelatinilyticus TaxID=2582913 RepID=UPI0011061063|nr:flagellar biosynthesis regulator FlaF [Luteithermobacter gelatinilyticus]|tara:strand:+ start:5709 stop:6143 length:435 start_codon:yes stop_codon:yes gene_type:complete